MTDFSQFSTMRVDASRTSTFTFWDLEGHPQLTVRPATEGNKPYFNSRLRRAPRTFKRIRKGQIDVGMIAEAREEDYKLYPQHIVVDWASVTDAAGKPVGFSMETCGEFLRAVPAHLFDELRDFCEDPANFMEDGERETADADDVEDVAKN